VPSTAIDPTTDLPADPTGVRPHAPRERRRRVTAATSWDATAVTVIVPAYNEEASLADTLRSLLAQTRRPAEIVVADDCSTDRTAEIARGFAAEGVRVLTLPTNSGSKAGAQTYALRHVRTPLVMAVDADTTLDPRAIERLVAVMDDPATAAACGCVIPRHVRTTWERGRYVEYLFAFTYYKQVQEYFGVPMIASGCFSVYRTDVLRAQGGWSTRTLAEDMDLTWSFYQAGRRVRFVPDAVCYPIEPRDLGLLGKQLRRWSHGFVQNVALHWRGLLRVPALRWAVAVSAWDAVVAAALYLFLLPVLAVALRDPRLLLGYVIDVPAVLVPALVGGARRGEVRRVLASLPAFFALRTVNAVFFLRAVWAEVVLRRPLRVYEKGH
jgi:biofilm PGA synthesis N-glycosyltransferase PgaC